MSHGEYCGHMVLTQPAVACKLDNENWAGTGDEGIPTVQCRC